MAAKKTATKKPATKKTGAKKTGAKTTKASKPQPAKATPATGGAFEALQAILRPYAKRLVVKTDTPEWLYLDTHTKAPNGKDPLFFAGVRSGKAYTSYYLMPVYANPELLEGISPALRKRMQGKSCFNFPNSKAADPDLVAELRELTRESFDRFQRDGRIGRAGKSPAK
ncbi:MAG: hypothetical protein HYV09_20365 [Deltaproteobacteria bacterium]|nr:hypothetical protein [Deltaproteobacteria bacterium]